MQAHQRPKLERYGDTLFLVLKTLWYVDEHDAVETGEIKLFVGHDFVVTRAPRPGQRAALGRARDLEAEHQVLTHGPGAVLYAVMRPRRRRVPRRWSTSWTSTSTRSRRRSSPPERTNDSARIYMLKREIAEVRRAVLPLREPARPVRRRQRPRRAPRRRRRSSATSPTTSPGRRRRSTPSTRLLSTRLRRPPRRRSRCSRTTTCARSPPAPR